MLFKTELGEQIWNKKYRNGNETMDEFIERVSMGDYGLKKLVENKEFLFGGRVLKNLGIDNGKSLSNCYVLKSDNLDSIKEIMAHCALMANVFVSEGGLGFDLTAIRPKGAKVKDESIVAPGVVSFMPLFSSVTGTIASGGRRGK